MPKRIIFPAVGQVAFEAFEPAALSATQVRVKTLYSLMSIGTETIILHQRYAEDTHFARMFSFPQLKTGVQAIGEVEAVGSSVTEFSPDEKVYMRAAHGSHQVLDAAACSPVPTSITDLKSACWAGLAKTAFRAAWAGSFQAGQHVLIIGAGPVGQMCLRWAATAGVESLAVADISGFRLELARRGGATHCFAGGVESCLPAVAELNAGRGPEVVVDTTGNAGVFRHALAAAGQFGKVILLGDSGYPAKQCLSSDAMTKGLTIQATHDSHDRDGWTQRRIDAHFFQLLAEGKFDTAELITHEFQPGQCVEAYRQADERREQSMGILYDWTTANY